MLLNEREHTLLKLGNIISESQNIKCSKETKRKPKNNGKQRENTIMTWNDRSVK